MTIVCLGCGGVASIRRTCDVEFQWGTPDWIGCDNTVYKDKRCNIWAASVKDWFLGNIHKNNGKLPLKLYVKKLQFQLHRKTRAYTEVPIISENGVLSCNGEVVSRAEYSKFFKKFPFPRKSCQNDNAKRRNK